MTDSLIKLERILIIFVCLSLAGIMVAQVLLRYIFFTPFLGIEEITVLLGLWIYFLGLIHVTHTKQHISSGVLQLFIANAKMLKFLDIFKLLLCLLSSLVFLYFSIQYLGQTHYSGRSSTYLSWPTSLWVASLMTGFLVSTLIFLHQLWSSIFRYHQSSIKAESNPSTMSKDGERKL